VQETVIGTGSFSDFKQGILDAFSGVHNFIGGIGDAAGGVMDLRDHVRDGDRWWQLERGLEVTMLPFCY